jgi:hypothetical protein
MPWFQHQTFLYGLEDAVRKAQELGRAALDASEGVDEALSAPVRDFARRLDENLWRRLRADADITERPYQYPLQSFLTQLEPVAQWARLS